MTKREDNRRKIDRQIYDTAIDLFCELGYRQTTLVDIAAEAGVSTRTLYRHYPTKESILRRFCRENIIALKAYVSDLDATLPLRTRILDIMVRDYSQMFCLFDPGHILHYTRDADGILNRFEIENILELESVYCTVFKHEQLSLGIEPNTNAQRCASIVVALYRHCNDVFRFRCIEQFNVELLRSYYAEHLDVVWDSFYRTLSADEGAAPLDRSNGHLYATAYPDK